VSIARRGNVMECVWFVHGMLEDEQCWSDLVAALAPREARAPRLPWSALDGTDWAGALPGWGYIDALARCALPRPQLIVAHSYGCNTVLEWMTRTPERQPAALVLVSPFYRARREDIDWDTLMNLAQGLEPLIAESIKTQDQRNRYNDWLLDGMVKRIRDRLGVYGWATFLQLFLRAPDLPLSRLTCPTLVVSGALDSYSQHHTNALLAERLPRGRHVCAEGAGHFIQRTHAPWLARTIAEFCAELAPPLAA